MKYRELQDNSYKKKKKVRYEWTSLNNVPDIVRKTIIVAEDASFWVHEGIDWYELPPRLNFFSLKFFLIDS